MDSGFFDFQKINKLMLNFFKILKLRLSQEGRERDENEMRCMAGICIELIDLMDKKSLSK